MVKGKDGKQTPFPLADSSGKSKVRLPQPSTSRPSVANTVIVKTPAQGKGGKGIVKAVLQPKAPSIGSITPRSKILSTNRFEGNAQPSSVVARHGQGVLVAVPERVSKRKTPPTFTRTPAPSVAEQRPKVVSRHDRKPIFPVQPAHAPPQELLDSAKKLADAFTTMSPKPSTQMKPAGKTQTKPLSSWNPLLGFSRAPVDPTPPASQEEEFEMSAEEEVQVEEEAEMFENLGADEGNQEDLEWDADGEAGDGEWALQSLGDDEVLDARPFFFDEEEKDAENPEDADLDEDQESRNSPLEDAENMDEEKDLEDEREEALDACAQNDACNEEESDLDFGAHLEEEEFSDGPGELHLQESDEDPVDAGEDDGGRPRKKARLVESTDQDEQGEADDKEAAGVEKVGQGARATLADWIDCQEHAFRHLPKLPEGWIRVWSRSQEKVYYYHVQSGKKQFKVPTN